MRAKRWGSVGWHSFKGLVLFGVIDSDGGAGRARDLLLLWQAVSRL